MVDQESQTNSFGVPMSPLETHSPTKEVTNSNTNGGHPLMGTSSFSETSILVVKNDNDEDEYDPVYAVPNHRNNNNGKEVHNTPIAHYNGRSDTDGSVSPRRCLSERTPPNTITTSKTSPPNSLPISSNNANSNYNLERSQSLRISRKSSRSLSSANKGGSLR